jgi:hypothetical protein
MRQVSSCGELIEGLIGLIKALSNQCLHGTICPHIVLRGFLAPQGSRSATADASHYEELQAWATHYSASHFYCSGYYFQLDRSARCHPR